MPNITLSLAHVDGAAYYLHLPNREGRYDVWAYANGGAKIRPLITGLPGLLAERIAQGMSRTLARELARKRT